MFEDLVGAYGGRLVVAVLGVGAALLCLIGILWIVRGRRGPSPFVRGGRNRNPRLQVLDAAAVDTRRRLVLVRRDDVEHLIMIGGPTDIVVESRITPSTAIGESRPQNALQPAALDTTVSAALPARPTPAPAARPTPPVLPLETAVTPQPRQEPPKELAPREMRAPQPAPVTATSAAPPFAAAGPQIAATRVEPAIANTPAPAEAQTAGAAAAATIVPIHRAPENRAPELAAAPPPAPALDDAAKLLDSARDRVFAERPSPAPALPSAPVSAARPAPPAGQHPTALGSDFERILEEEMASNLADRDAALAGRGTRSPQGAIAGIPTAGPAVAVPRQDPPLQAEVARIFGEMSASRDK